MKNTWLRWSSRIDALTLRERMLVFAAVLAGLVYASYSLLLGPMFERQEALAAEVAQNQSAVAQVDAQVLAVVQGSQVDPDAGTRARLAALQGEVGRLEHDLRAMQASLVQPEKIAALLETMLRSNGRLRLVSLRTLPVTGLSEDLPTGEPAPSTAVATAAAPSSGPKAVLARMGNPVAPAAPAAVQAADVPEIPELVYRHGVEITLQGGYADMVAYMEQLDALPVRLIWGKARLDAREHRQARLTLTLFTLSLDKDWMKL